MGNHERKLYKNSIVSMFTEDKYNLTNIAQILKINRLDVKKILMEEGLYTGTQEVCEFVESFFSSKVRLTKRNNNSSNNYTIVIQGNEQIIRYLNMLYNDKSVRFSLDRKKEKYYELIKQYNI